MKKRNIILIIISVALVTVITSLSIFFFVFYLPDKREQSELERSIKEYYQNKLSLYQIENESYGDYQIDIAFLGDSLTDWYDLKTYYPQYATANRGIGGDTTHGLEDRLKVSVYDLKPKIVVMLIGGNNIDTMFENYEDILIGLKNNLPKTKVVLVSLTAMGKGLANKNQIATYNNVIIKKLAGKYGNAFVDIFTPLFNETTGEIYSEYTTDGAHLTDKGYQVFTDVLTPVLEGLLS